MVKERQHPEGGRSRRTPRRVSDRLLRWVEQPPESYVPIEEGEEMLDAWATWEPGAAPLLLEGDRQVMETSRSRKAIVCHGSWREAIRSPDFGAPGDGRLHLGLLPQPFIGNLRTASIYVLLLNPGTGPSDYFGEGEVPEYRAALLANLKQEFREGVVPFLYLDPRFSWHGGYAWWHGKLAGVMEALARDRGISFAAARAELAGRVASIELVPYHSGGFRDAGGWLKGLESVALARGFVSEFVLPRVRRGKAIVIVTRKVKEWGLPRTRGVVAYSPGQARGAHLTLRSLGGKAILRFLKRKC